MKTISIAMLLVLTACATITKDSDQAITVTTEPAGASCLLTNAVGSWEIDETPGDAIVKRNFSPLQIQCNKDGLDASTTLEPKTRGRAYGNILLGGVPAIVDANTGAGYEYAPGAATLVLK